VKDALYVLWGLGNVVGLLLLVLGVETLAIPICFAVVYISAFFIALSSPTPWEGGTEIHYGTEEGCDGGE
jgi:uncharacterized membrane protein YphA (DoxX/SURF4 family)